MSKKAESDLIVALDIGTSKVVSIVADILPDGRIDVIGVGSCASRGIKKGIVVNIDATIQSVQRAIEEAELMAGCKIHSVYTGIAGSHVRSINSHGIVAIREGEVTQVDVDRVIEAAKAVAIPADQKILHVLPQEFIIDHQDGIRDPIGMSGVRLEAKIHMIMGSVSAAQNIINCIRRCGLEVDDIFLEQIAASEAVLTEDEKHLGVCLIDIGGGTTDVAVFADSAIKHTTVIPIAGDQITNDIAIALRTPTQNAEKIKLQHAVAMKELVDDDYEFEVTHTGGRGIRSIGQAELAAVVEPRYDELFSLVQAELRRVGLEDILGSGIVITGGSAKMSGVVELAEDIFNIPVRLGTPKNISGLNETLKSPIYATGIGLLLCGLQNQQKFNKQFAGSFKIKTFLGRVKNWFQGNF